MLVKDLKHELAERGLKRTGNKAELVARLLFHFRKIAEQNGELAPDDDIDLPPPPDHNLRVTGAAVISSDVVNTPSLVTALLL